LSQASQLSPQEAHQKGLRVALSYGNASLKSELALPMTSDFEKGHCTEKLQLQKKIPKKIAAAFFEPKKPPAAIIFQPAYLK
jgi:hypothetical protein